MGGRGRVRGNAGEIYDFVVVGAGPAGCAVAARLAEGRAGASVALIEAGPAKAPLLSDIPLGIAALVPGRSKANYAYETVPQPGLGGRRGYQPRGRGVGGSSLINAMIYTRGHPGDYDDWARLGCTGWSYADLLPLFRRSEDNARGEDAFHGVGGPLRVEDHRDANPATAAFVAAAEEAGFPVNSTSTGPCRRASAAISCSRRTGGASTPRAPISKPAGRSRTSASLPTARRRGSSSTADAPSASRSGAGGAMR